MKKIVKKPDALADIENLLKNRDFLHLATADKSGQPNAAPKFLLKFKGPVIYLVDYVMGTTVSNLQENPRASIPLINTDNLEGYRLNGGTHIICSGKECLKLAKEFREVLVRRSASRVIEGIRTGKKHSHFELEISEDFAVIKFTIEEITKIGPKGDLSKKKIK